MKLYTESQIREALDNEDFAYISDTIIAQMKPVELPSDVESGYFAAGAMKYNKWMKEQILNQNK